MRVKVDIMLQIDLKKHDDRCIKIENLMKERGIKEESVEYSLKSYYLQIYQHDPLFREILLIYKEIVDEEKLYEPAKKDEESKRFWELYNEQNDKLEKMLSAGEDEEVMFDLLQTYGEKMGDTLGKKVDVGNPEEDRRNGCQIYIMGHNPEYTEEELNDAIGYTIKGDMEYEVADDEDEFLEWCDACRRCTEQKGSYILNSNLRIKWAGQKKRVFSSDDGLATFVTVPMYKYLRENEISPENFRPAYFDHKKKKLAGYQFIGSNILPEGSYSDSLIETKENCKKCGRRLVQKDSKDIEQQYFHNAYIDCEKVDKLGDVNVARHELALRDQKLIFSRKMLDLLRRADKHILWTPVFPLSVKEVLERNEHLFDITQSAEGAAEVFRINAEHFRWISGSQDDPEDRCLHGDVTAVIGEEKFYCEATVSACALYLLKTLTENHIIDTDCKLIPCCGHLIMSNEVLSNVTIIGCDNGIDWSVLHEDDQVRLITESGRETRVALPEYKAEVYKFADKVEAFYNRCTPKDLSRNEFDRDGYIAFWNEWHRRRGEA